jgi:tetratricopeptide (TPR) repeat protein
VTDPGRQVALGSLQGARSALARLSPGRDPEDTAADLIEVWVGIETSLRALLNGSTLSGQELIREVRKREMLTLTQAHALLDFLSVRERLNDHSYRPTQSDIEAARHAVWQLDAGLSSPRASTAAAPVAAAAPPPANDRPVESASSRRQWPGQETFERLPTWAWIVIAVAALGLASMAVLYGARGGGGDLADARRALREGRREAARAEFERAARENPREAEPHLFLARMSRDDGDYATARREAEAAIRAEPRNALAHREMGTVLYTTGNYELARPFFVRALNLAPGDNTTQGLLGCTLVQLGRRDEGIRFLNRAGSGPWSTCASLAPFTQ